MTDQRLGGDIVYIASKNALFAGPNNVAYSAAKADQAHQVRLLAAELGELPVHAGPVEATALENVLVQAAAHSGTPVRTLRSTVAAATPTRRYTPS